MKIQEVIKHNLCIGCGICTFDERISEMKYVSSKGLYIPKLNKKEEYEIGDKVCPGKGYNIYKISKELYGEENYSTDLGVVHSSFVAHSNDVNILCNASSGGVMTEILLYLLKNKIVDKVAITKFIYTNNGPKTETFLTDKICDVMECQGSKYCPVDISSFIQMVKAFNGTIAYVGTPCQIAGIRNMQKIDDTVKEKIKYTIANFCGGFKNYNNIIKIAKHHNIDYNKITYFRFRGEGQPGSLKMIDNHGSVYQAPYPKYVGYTGYSKLSRCHLCVDATGELADFACGDAWLDKYLQDTNAWSIIICRNKEASSIIQAMAKESVLTLNEIDKEDVSLSQKINIKSKKYRYISRNKLYKFLGYNLPTFDGGFQNTYFPLRIEFKIFIVHKFKELIERFNIYKYFRSIIKKDF